MRRAVRLWSVSLVLSAAAAAAGCVHEQLLGTMRPGVSATVTMAPGAEAFPLGDVLRVSLLGVPNDSRCPIDAMCVWAGNAVVRIGLGLGMGPTAPYDLNTNLDPRDVIFGGYRITLVSLAPSPVSYQPIPQNAYRVTLRIERFGPD